jgi:hypothetical protein
MNSTEKGKENKIAATKSQNKSQTKSKLNKSLENLKSVIMLPKIKIEA